MSEGDERSEPQKRTNRRWQLEEEFVQLIAGDRAKFARVLADMETRLRDCEGWIERHQSHEDGLGQRIRI